MNSMRILNSNIEHQESKREFLKKGLKFGIAAIVTVPALYSCTDKNEEKISPPEDLMREHGLLNRILLIYDHCNIKLSNHETFPLEALHNSANIIRSFIEDYHEKQEEEFLFPRFEKANTLTELVKTLRIQHQAGRVITEQIIQFSGMKSISADEGLKLTKLLSDFNAMYRPHEAREDTVLFPALSKIVSKNEYDAMGEDFEKNEHKLFGEDGFDTMVDKVGNIEKQLGIFDLSLFTPQQ
jgi:hemerythrin-like domain-containing protein